VSNRHQRFSDESSSFPGPDDEIAARAGPADSAAFATVSQRVLKVGGSGKSSELNHNGWDFELGTASASWIDSVYVAATDGHPEDSVGIISVRWSLVGLAADDWSGAKATLRFGDTQRSIRQPDKYDTNTPSSWPDLSMSRTDSFQFRYGLPTIPFGLSLFTGDPRTAPSNGWYNGVNGSESWTAQVEEVFIPKGATLIGSWGASEQFPFKVTEVPEPETYALFAAGLLGLTLWLRRPAVCRA